MFGKSSLLNTALTDALEEVTSKKVTDGITAGHSDLLPATRETLQGAFHEMKAHLTRASEKLSLEEHGLKLSMGMYQASATTRHV